MNKKNLISRNTAFIIALSILAFLIVILALIAFYQYYLNGGSKAAIPKLESKAAIPKLENNKNIGIVIDGILLTFYNKKNNLNKDKESRFHGAGHIKTVVMIANELINLYKKYSAEGAINTFLKDGQEDLILIAAAFHDAGRVEESDDHDELSSALLFLSYCIENNLCDIKTAIKLAICISAKSHLEEDIKNGAKQLIDFLSLDLLNIDDMKNSIDKCYSSDKKKNPKAQHKVSKLKELLNFDSIAKASQGYMNDINKINNFIDEGLKNNLAALAIYDADCIDVIRTRDHFDEQYTKYANFFKDKNSDPYKEFHDLQQKWESKRNNYKFVNYQNGNGLKLDFQKFAEKNSKSSKTPEIEKFILGEPTARSENINALTGLGDIISQIK